MGSHFDRMQIIARTMYIENKVRKNMFQESKICFKNRKFVSRIETLFQESKICFKNRRRVSRVKNLFQESKICFKNRFNQCFLKSPSGMLALPLAIWARLFGGIR